MLVLGDEIEGQKLRADSIGATGTTEQLAEKVLSPYQFREKHTSGAEARIHFARAYAWDKSQAYRAEDFSVPRGRAHVPSHSNTSEAKGAGGAGSSD